MNPTAASQPTQADLLAGVATFTVCPADTFIRARELLGDVYHVRYDYKIDRVMPDDGGNVPMYFLSCLTGEGKKARFVYVGVIHPQKGLIRLTSKSAFPATATRVRVAERTLAAIFANRGDKIAAAGWTVTGEVLRGTRSEVECPF